MSPPHILIVGSGIGGIALAQGFKKNGISFTLFERDLSPTARAQGYRVRLASDKGAGALRECLDQELWELFESTCAMIAPGGARFNAVDGTRLTGFGKSGQLHSKGAPLARNRGPPGMGGVHMYNVDRGLLRSLLLLGLEDRVKFGKWFKRYELTPTGVRVHFKDETVFEGTFLVGADGTASAIRRQFLPNYRYVDTGSRVIYGKTPVTPELERRLPPELLRGISVVHDKMPFTLFLEPIRFAKDISIVSRGRLTHVEDYIYWVLGGSGECFPASDDEFQALSHRAAADMTLRMTKHWNPAFRALFELQNIHQTSPLRMISAKPERPDWISSTRVTLLGDAAHAAMPIGAVGANAALQDAASLLKLVVEEGISEETMERYISRMWEDAVSNIEAVIPGSKMLLGFRGFENAKEVEF